MTTAPRSRRNLLLITSDQQHWFTLGYLNPEIHTPNLDRLAARGTTFSRGYTVNPTCTPTRASIITGQYPSQHGAWALGTKLPDDADTVGERLSKAGYRTALIGKAHFQQLLDHPHYRSIESNPLQQDLDWWRAFTGPFYGFDDVRLARNHADENHVGQHYGLWLEAQGFDWRPCFRKPAGTAEAQYGSWNIPEQYHYNTWIAEETTARLDRYADEGSPFFLWASFLDPHPPYLAPEPWADLYADADLTLPELSPDEHRRNPHHFRLTQEETPDFSAWREPDGHHIHGFCRHRKPRPRRRRDMELYYGMISLMDKYIGKILDRLEALGLERDTVIVFTTDHGHFFGQHGLTAKGPFLYEDMVRVPFIVSNPGTIPEGVTSPALQSLVDLAPTFLRLAGLPIPRTMTGIDQTAVWYGSRPAARDHVIIENRHQPTTIHQRCFVNQRYKITVYCDRDQGELFDFEDDPGEINNLWDAPEAAPLKSHLLLKLIQAELAKEPIWMPRVAVA